MGLVILERDNLKYFYCYSPPLCMFLEQKNIKSINEKDGTHPITKKKYKVFLKDEILDNALNDWKQVKVDAIEYIKNKNIIQN